MKKTLGISLIYAVVIILVFGVVMSAVSTEKVGHITDRETLAAFNFDEDFETIEESVADKYNNKLLSPSEIDNYVPDDVNEDYEYYVTYRFKVPVTDGVTYGLTCKKSDYALNVFVDGKLVARTGNVADNAKEFVPTAAAYEAFFTGKGDTAEIVIQRANFNHHKHYSIWFRFGPAEKITSFSRKLLLENVIVSVVLLTASLMNLGMFFCFPMKKETMWFSVICFVAVIRTVFPNVTAYLVPNLNWYVSHKLETCSIVAILFFTALYVSCLFEKYVNRKLKNTAVILSGAIFALYAFAPSSIYTRYNEVCIIISMATIMPMLVLMVIKMIRMRKTIPASNLLSLIGVVFYGLISLNDAFGYGGYLAKLDIFGTTTGISLFAFFNSLALAIDFRSSKELLEKTEARERELAHTNETLTRLDKIRENFLADLSHELKTPLTVIATNAAVSSKQVSMGKADDMTAKRLDNIEREAVRLGKMVEKMKNSAKGQYSEKAEVLNMSQMLSSAADFCSPLCARNDNSIYVKCEEGIEAFASSNMIFHCLYNLISNATKHSHNSSIELNCFRKDNGVIVSVCDHGDGMSDEQMKHAFERGYSGDSSTGIGLPLCRELIENEGGTIALENTQGGGLTVSFILKGVNQNGENSDDRG